MINYAAAKTPLNKDEHGNINLPAGIWDNPSVKPEVRRLPKPTPLTLREVLAKVTEIGNRLEDALAFWSEWQGRDRFETERSEAVSYLAEHEARCKAYRLRLQEIESSKSSLQQHFDNVSSLETATNHAAREAQASIAEVAAQSVHAQPFASLSRPTQLEVMRRNPIRKLQEVATAFYARFGKTPDADRNIALADSTIERIKQGLDLVGSVASEELTK